MTIISVSKADLLPAGQRTADSAVEQFFDNIKILANTDSKQAVILGSMLFTLVIWFITAISLFLAMLFYVFFLWHYVPASDGRLSIYCRRKINRRVSRVVSVRVKKALEDEERRERKRQLKEDQEAMKKGIRPTAQRQPTLPILADTKENNYPESILSRSTSQSTLPAYTSRPPTRNGSDPPTLQRQPTLPEIEEDEMPPPFARMNTTTSTSSLDSNAPLLSEAGNMGMSEPVRKPLPNGSRDYFGRPLVNRNMSSSSQMNRASPTTPAPSYHSNSYRPGGPSRQTTQDSMAPSYGPPTRTNTQESLGRPYGPSRQNTGFSASTYREGSGDSYEMSPQAPGSSMQPGPANRSYSPYNPNRPAAGTPMSNNTAPILSQPQTRQPPTDYFGPQAPQRSATMPYSSSIYDDYGATNASPAPGPMASRSVTAGANPRGGYGSPSGVAPRMGPPSATSPQSNMGRRPMPNHYAPRPPM